MLQGMLFKRQLEAGPKLPSAVEEYKFAQSQGYKGSYEDFKRMGTPSTNITVNAGDKELSKALGGAAGKRIEDSFNAATEAQSTLQSIADVKPILAEGVFSGPLSQAPRTVAQVASSLGVTGKDTDELLQRTAQAMQTLANFELSAAKAMRGQGAITENERMLIQRASAGRLDQFTSKEVQALISAMEKTANFRIQSHQKQLNVLRQNAPEDLAPLLNMYDVNSLSIPAPKQPTFRYNPQTRQLEQVQ
jgi:hypothetical protein